jgi:hypothetical protein
MYVDYLQRGNSSIKSTALISIIFALLIIASPIFSSCQGPSANTTPQQPGIKKLALADYSDVFDIMQALPRSFAQADAEKLGLSNKQLGLGGAWSEVAAFISPQPFQLVYCSYNIVDNPVGRVTADSELKNEDLIRKTIEEGIMQAAMAQGLKTSAINIKISSPAIGDMALLGEGAMGIDGKSLGCDILKFKVGKVYFMIVSVYNPERVARLPDISSAIIDRLKVYELK